MDAGAATACGFYKLEQVVRQNHAGIHPESQGDRGKVHLLSQFEVTASYHLLPHLVLVQQRVLVEMA